MRQRNNKAPLRFAHRVACVAVSYTNCAGAAARSHHHSWYHSVRGKSGSLPGLACAMKPVQFGKYSLLERISHGGMAEVFRAKAFGEAGFERDVAIKLLLPAVATDDEFITMLIDEAKIAGQLNHANIAQIFDLGVAEGRYYIVQEFVAGLDLRSILKDIALRHERLTVAQACHIVVKICEGLDYAHNKRDINGSALHLVHRDISPQNILISEEGEVKLIDFGIAKAEGRATKTMAGLVKGKFAYMSPEQIRGLPVDRRSDVFACGIVLHELIANRPLFRRKSEFETLKQARNAEAPPPSQFNPECPPELDKIVLKALARHVDDRYPTASQLRDDLWAFLHQSGHHYSRTQLGEWMQLLLARRPPKRANSDSSESASMVIEVGSKDVQSIITPTAGDSVEITARQPDPTEEGDAQDYGEIDTASGSSDDAATLVDPMANKIAEPSEAEDDYDAEWAAAVMSRRPLTGARGGSSRPPKSQTPTPVFDMSEMREQIEMSRPDTPDVVELLGSDSEGDIDDDNEPTREGGRKAHRYYMEQNAALDNLEPSTDGYTNPVRKRPRTADEPPTQERPKRRASDGLRAVVGMDGPVDRAYSPESDPLSEALTAPGSRRLRSAPSEVPRSTALGAGAPRPTTLPSSGAPAPERHMRGRLPSISSSPPVRDDAIIEFAPPAQQRRAEQRQAEMHGGAAAAQPEPRPEAHAPPEEAVPAPLPAGAFVPPPGGMGGGAPGIHAGPAMAPAARAGPGGKFAMPPQELGPPRAHLTEPPIASPEHAPHASPNSGFPLAMGSEPRDDTGDPRVGFWQRRSTYLLLLAVLLLLAAAGSSVFLSMNGDDSKSRDGTSEAAS